MEFTVNINPTIAIFTVAGIGAVISLIIWYANVNSDRDSFKEFMKKVEKRLDDIFDRVTRIGRGDLVESKSPLRLTDLGKQIAEQTRATEIAEAMSKVLEEKAVGKSAYDIQQLCFDWVTEDKLTAEHQKIAKDVAFSRGITMPQVMEVIAIELRDRLLMAEQVKSLP